MPLDRGWHLAVCVTDLPLQTARRPVIADVTPRTASRSCPCPRSVRSRCASAQLNIIRLIGHMLGDIALETDAGKADAR